MQLVPDMSTLRHVPWYNGHAIVLTDMLRNPQFSEALDGEHVFPRMLRCLQQLSR